MRNETTTLKSELPYEKYIWEGFVVDVLDGEENGVLKVRIPELDHNVSDINLPLCYCLTNFSFFRVLPKVGERVTVIFRTIYETQKQNQDQRYWVNIVHSTVIDTNDQPFFLDSNSHYLDSPTKAPKKAKNVPSSRGIFPSKSDVSISSRNNSDIILRENSVLLRSGSHLRDNNLIFNNQNPSYIAVDFSTKSANKTNTEPTSTNTFVAPDTQIILQTTNLSGTITIREKESQKVLSTSTYNKSERAILISSMKTDLLQFESQYPRWEIVSFDPEFESLQKLYQGDSAVQSDQTILAKKSIDFSTILMASDKIMLVSHLNNEFNVKAQPDLYKDSILDITTKGHPIPLGDKLNQLLDLMRQVMVNHVHPYDGMKTVQEDLVLKLMNFDLNSILNPNVLTG